MGDSCQKYPRIEGAARSFEDTANCDHSNHTIPTHEAVFDKSPLAIPADEARVNLEPLEQLEIVTKLGDRIAYDGECFMPSCNPQHTGTREPMNAANVGERKIATVVDMAIEIQVVWPDAEINTRGGE